MLLNCCYHPNDEFNKTKITMPDSWTGVANGQTELKLDSAGKEFGLITYIVSSGEIRRIWVNSNYDEKYFCKVLLKEAIADIKKAGTDICWVSSAKSNELWKNIYGKKFSYSNPISKINNYEGYYLKL